MRSIAIIGASANKEKFGNKCVRVYKDLGWKVFPINPVEKAIEGVKCYSSINDVPEKPDLVSIYIPSKVTLTLLEDFKKIGLKEVILNPGAESEELIAALQKAGIKSKLVCSIRMQGISPEDY
ncbi:MAG TPA: CoA-binding protein [archaeon]|nr:CoA-binding protein [archaeon]